MSHTVTITRLPNEESDDYEYTFGGTHGADCAVLWECKRKACRAMNPEYEPFDERLRHGKTHYYRDGMWCCESDDCALRYVFECVTEEETFDGVALGTYPIVIEWDDGWWIEVQDKHPITDGSEA